MIEEKAKAAKIIEEAQADRAKALVMRIKVYSPYKTYFEDDAYSISAVNATGPFDILPHHHNFMTLLGPCELVIRTSPKADGHEQRIRISGGLMHVKVDKVTVFLDI